MGDLALFAIAAKRMTWLSTRQAAIAGNVANVDTPNFQARDVAPFDSYLEKSRLDMSATAPGHFKVDGDRTFDVEVSRTASGDTKHSGNNVSLEHELLRAGEVKGAHRLAVSVVGAFHGMLLSALKG